MESSKMIRDYGETDKFVFILVRGMRNSSGGTLGYSPGLRTDWRKKESIVVLDFDHTDQLVTVHELFHGLGAPHTCDGNGNGDNIYNPGFQIYRDMQYHADLGPQYVGYSGLVNQPSLELGSFSTYIEDDINFRNRREVDIGNGQTLFYDTRTIMYQIAVGYNELFTSEQNGFSSAYSNILDSYYREFVE
jgi:hypothetical protein